MHHVADVAIIAQFGSPQHSRGRLPLFIPGVDTDCKLERHQRCADVAHALMGNETPSTGDVQPPYPTDGSPLVQPHGVQHSDGLDNLQERQHSAVSEGRIAEDNTTSNARLQATGRRHGSLSRSDSKGSMSHGGTVSDAAMDQMLAMQLQRIKDSAVMLPEPAEVLVTDLLDYRWLPRCAVLCCAACCVYHVMPRLFWLVELLR